MLLAAEQAAMEGTGGGGTADMSLLGGEIMSSCCLACRKPCVPQEDVLT
jgi:hypothetical protein